ncbi:MAG TPA: hypothetical protein VKS01_00190 [Bryobacteraceae bacterium]|nr:hypothetical protein [Bryobacteraceae bacterium]
MKIEIVKRADGEGVLRCTRDDGTVAWQKQRKHASHFALHDMTHFSVETVLGYRLAFFGLIAEGWEIEETEGNSERGALPPEAIEVEKIVGLFDAERAGGERWSAEDFTSVAPRPLSEQELDRIRALRSNLFAQWQTIAIGQALALEFAATPVPTR